MSVVVRAKSIERGMEVSEMGEEYAAWVTGVQRAFKDSGLFEDVSIGLYPATRRVRVEIVREQDVNQTAFTLTAVTWGMIPMTWSADYSVALELETPVGSMRTFKSKETHRIWTQVLLLPLMPFASPKTRAVNGVYEMTLDALTAAQRDGAI